MPRRLPSQGLQGSATDVQTKTCFSGIVMLVEMWVAGNAQNSHQDWNQAEW
ncbi:MAG: hypothetical protein ACR2NK_10780 [Mariniblastus sp.]